MIYSLYPTDSEANFAQTLEQIISSSSKLVFTSLHIPESDHLQNFLQKLGQIFVAHQINFVADISPLTLDKLNLPLSEMYQLKKYGIFTVRIDFGFSLEEIRQIAAQDFSIAVNASVVDEIFVKDLSALPLIGWHNFYPRPDTGLTISFFEAQNKIFQKYHLPIYTFIPGEKTFRAPLFLGLPTLENQRFQNAYSNFLTFKRQYPHIEVVLAEGDLFPQHLEWISLYESKQIITLPLVETEAEIHQILINKPFWIRPEETNSSWRLEGTRSLLPKPRQNIPGVQKMLGSLQMDTELYGRYEGEIHIMKRAEPLTAFSQHVGQIASPYLEIIPWLNHHCQVQFR